MKRNNFFTQRGILIILAVAAVIFLFAPYLFSVIGVSETIVWNEEFYFDDSQTGTGIATGNLTLPINTTEFAFTPDYRISTLYMTSSTAKAAVKYEIFNVKNNSWETIHDKSWTISGKYVHIVFDGETVYQTGIPERFHSVRVGSTSYKRYYGCLDGMSVNEAKTLNPWSEGTSSYSYYCLYPDSSLPIVDYDEDYDDIEYFPVIIVKNSDYITNENKVLFRLTYKALSNGVFHMDEGNFKIRLWDVKTLKTIVWKFENGTCNSYEKQTYEVLPTDYYTLRECFIGNNITSCGDGICNGDETCSTCAEDCGNCNTIFCGDGICNNGETCNNCSQDCGDCQTNYCGDSICNNGETCSTCVADCGTCPLICGDSICNGDETCSTCVADCGNCNTIFCGDNICNGLETCTSCAKDCGECELTCGDGICNNGETCSTCQEDCACVDGQICSEGVCKDKPNYILIVIILALIGGAIYYRSKKK